VRIPLSLAWFLVLGTFGTAAILRQFHDRTPTAPGVSPIVGSALFAAIFLLLLVTAREQRSAAAPGHGVRLIVLTPLLLLLLIEKWVSLSLYPPLFDRLSPWLLEPAFADAVYRALAGVELLAVCVLVGWLSLPTLRKVRQRARPKRWPAAALATVLVIGGSYLLLALLSSAIGGGLRLRLPRPDALLFWVVGGQAVLAFAEELYYRGLLLAEMERIAPRLGVRGSSARRWVALLSTSLLFGLEHLALGPPWEQSLREGIFVVSLGLLFGILVLVSGNLLFAAGVHAWINWLLLGAAPYFIDASGQPALPAGTYIAVALILAFVATYGFRLRRPETGYREPALES
jgi:membrane protease YdiL (CAAX protease family)